MKKRIQLVMNEKIYKELQKRAIDEDTTVSAILEKLATDYLALYPHD